MPTPAVANNNPGNLKDPATGAFQKFSDPTEGMNALEQDLTDKVTGNTKTGLTPKSTLYNFASVYAPASDSNDPYTYSQNLAKQLGVNVNTPLAELQNRIPDFARAVAHNEDPSASALGQAPTSNYASMQVGQPPQLTHSQIIANINAMEQQGANPPEIQSYLDSLKQQGTPQNQQQNGYVNPSPMQMPTPPPPAPTAAGADPSGGFLQGLQEDMSGTNPDSIGTQIENTVKGAGNFLFPAVGDIANDIQGKNQKTPLQQLGDVGTSVLGAASLIPGADVIADPLEAARGADAVAEGASGTAKSGILQKILGSKVVKGAGTGYAYGTAQNLSSGQSLGQAVAPNSSNLLGGASGGILESVVPRVGGLVKGIAGISPQISNELESIGSKANPEDLNLYNAYVNATKEHASNVRAPAPLTIAADNVDNAADIIGAHTDQAGAEVGAVKKSSSTVPMDNTGVSKVADEFQQKVASEYGVNLTTGIDGKVRATPIPGSMRQIAPKDLGRIENVYQQLQGLAGGSVKNGGEVIDNLNDLVDRTNQDTYGKTNDPLEGLFQHIAGGIKDTMHTSSPELAAADKKFSDLKNLQKEVRTMAGGQLQRGELLMKRLFSGDKSGDVNDFFKKVQAETGVDLVKHAVLAKHAIESYGSKADQSLLQQAIEGGVKAHAGGVIPAIMNMAGSAARHTFANPETIGRNLISGKSGGILPRILMNQGAHVGAKVGGMVP